MHCLQWSEERCANKSLVAGYSIPTKYASTHWIDEIVLARSYVVGNPTETTEVRMCAKLQLCILLGQGLMCVVVDCFDKIFQPVIDPAFSWPARYFNGLR